MFKFLVTFVKVLSIACIIGVGLRVADVICIKQEMKEKQDNNIGQNISSIEQRNTQDIEENLITESTVKEESISKIEDKSSKSTNEVIQKEVAKTEIKQEDKKEHQVVANQNEQQSQTIEKKQQEITTPLVEQENILVVQNEEKYMINNSLIETMKSAINSNVSETMNTYGYEIVVDSNITELTNQFTYTEYRLTSKLNNRFGTIKIYAQDYYRNGQYVNTQCFIY